MNWPPYGSPAWPRDKHGAPLRPKADGSPAWPNQRAYDEWHRWFTGQVPARQRSSNTPPQLVAAAVIVGIVVTVVIALHGSSGSTSNPDSHVTGTSLTSDQLDNAYETCKGAVNDQLKSPASASYPNFATNTADIQVVKNGSDSVTITSQVDSDNSFGAKLRTFFSCTATTADGGSTWTADATLIPQ